MNVEDVSSNVKKERSKKILIESFDKKVTYLLNKPLLEGIDLYYYVKEFFREYLDLKKELSFEEIKQELENIYVEKATKQKIISFIDKVSVIEYKDKDFNEREVRNYIKEFHELTKSLLKQEKSSKSLIYKILKTLRLKKLQKENEEEIKSYTPETNKDKEEKTLPSTEEENTENFENSPNINLDEPIELEEENIYDMIEKAKNIEDKTELVALYKKINELYEEKTTEEQARIYPELLIIYEKLAKNK